MYNEGRKSGLRGASNLEVDGSDITSSEDYNKVHCVEFPESFSKSGVSCVKRGVLGVE